MNKLLKWALCALALIATPALAQPDTSARSFASSVGVAGHLNWLSKNWGSLNWTPTFNALGVHHLRTSVGHNKPVLVKLNELTSAGVSICALQAESDRTASAADLAFLAANVPASRLECIESLNEFNNGHASGWASALRSYSLWLYGTAKANQKLVSVPVAAPSIWNRIPADYAALGNLEPKVNLNNIHYYTDGRRPTLTPEGTLAQALQNAKAIAPTRPIIITEYGYQVAGPDRPLMAGTISELAQAKYMLRGLFDLYAAGVQRTYIYEFMDDPGTKHYWGLCDAALKCRQSYRAVQNLMALFNDDRPAAVPLAAAISGPSDLRVYKFARSDGRQLIVLYRDIDSWNRSTRTDINPAPVTVTVTFGQPVAAEIFEPTFSAVAKSMVTTATKLPVQVADHVVVVRATPQN